MAERSIPNPSDTPPQTPEQEEGREELESIIPAGPAVPVPASMMKPALEGSLFMAFAGGIIALAIGFVLVAAFEADRSVMWISAIVGAAAGSVLGFVLGGTIGGTREEQDDLRATINRNAKARPS